jgi:hypothetical protein
MKVNREELDTHKCLAVMVSCSGESGAAIPTNSIEPDICSPLERKVRDYRTLEA